MCIIYDDVSVCVFYFIFIFLIIVSVILTFGTLRVMVSVGKLDLAYTLEGVEVVVELIQIIIIIIINNE